VREKIDMLVTREMEDLAGLVANLKEDEVLNAITRHLHARVSPIDILEACQKGMRLVGSMHEEGHYYIAGLIMAGEIMHQAMDLLRGVMIKERRGKTHGRVVLGTIAGDIHDIGKNLFRDLLECHGVAVLDLGVDVPPADFVRAESEFKPHLIGASVLITESFPRLRELVQLSRESARPGSERPFILIGGAQVDGRVFRMSGADDWAQDAFTGIEICKRFMRGRKKQDL
jgi:methanogenic corrinoid protein MtbC1